MSLKALASTITLTTQVDIDDMTPSHHLDIQLEEPFTFLGSQKGILANWLRHAAAQLSPPEPIEVTDAMIEAFGTAWESTPAGEPGARRRAGLEAALAIMGGQP